MPDIRIVSIDLMEYDGGSWKLDGSVDRRLTEAPFSFEIRHNGAVLPFRYVPRPADVKLEGSLLTGRIAFSAELPCGQLARINEIEFVCVDGRNGAQQVLPVVSVNYQARVSSFLKHSYWCFGKYMVTMRECSGEDAVRVRTEIPAQKPAAGWRNGLVIRRAGKAARVRQELQLLSEMLCAPYGSRQMFAVRCAYWLARPFYTGKRIWITFDKLYKGGDCGEYFYKYMMGRKGGGIVPAYVIRRDVPDCRRLQKEGYSPAAHRSLGQRLSYLYAEMVFGTHSGVNSFCGFNNWEIRFVQDRLRAVNTCIQHGLSVQDLSADSNRVINNNKRYYCASRCEVVNLSKPEYDYAPGVLRLTGIPRYDGLINREKKQVLIAPTWRASVAMPSVMGETRPYNPEFRSTDYYRIFQELLLAERLSQTAERTGYRIIFLLHPVLGAQKQDFHAGDGMEILTAQEVSYETLLTESSLLVTDYSGIQFDFAYMRKPLVYFHPPQLPPHYRDGGFSYEEQGFGEICTQTGQLISMLCGYMESGCRLKETYRARQEAFFAFDDHENCRRIYEDALKVIGSRGK